MREICILIYTHSASFPHKGEQTRLQLQLMIVVIPVNYVQIKIIIYNMSEKVKCFSIINDKTQKLCLKNSNIN